ncbi:HAD-IA family hydrolase [Aliiglaciecola litoralis]|uniref:Phosphoglycolate phosphatase n=1 Tax=Aliiglaciecola litoralis TaxID=582857 RepID=A0ABN1LCE1_9ALTE
MLNFDGVLFDLDGTLLDTAPDLGNALNHVLRQHGVNECSYDLYRPVASNGAKGLLELGFGDQFQHINYDTARQSLLDYYHLNICTDTQPFDGVADYLAKLNSASIPWGIVTNKPGWLTDKLLQHFPIMSKCQCVVSGDTYENSKPHPQPLLEAAKALNLSPENTLYVGDAKRDIQAAHAANMRSVAALYGYLTHPQEAQDWQAEYAIQHISELSALNKL